MDGHSDKGEDARDAHAALCRRKWDESRPVTAMCHHGIITKLGVSHTPQKCFGARELQLHHVIRSSTKVTTLASAQSCVPPR